MVVVLSLPGGRMTANQREVLGNNVIQTEHAADDIGLPEFLPTLTCHFPPSIFTIIHASYFQAVLGRPFFLSPCPFHAPPRRLRALPRPAYISPHHLSRLANVHNACVTSRPQGRTDSPPSARCKLQPPTSPRRCTLSHHRHVMPASQTLR